MYVAWVIKIGERQPIVEETAELCTSVVPGDRNDEDGRIISE